MTLHAKFLQLYQQLSQAVLGQQQLVERLLLTLLADGHLLVEGAPGLAKTRAIQALATHLQVGFKRIQFTPDLLPADLTGTEILQAASSKLVFRPGPLFSNLILADEINRAPAKVQAALLEAMAERQISASGVTRQLPDVFMVMATQNPLEQEGTYPLPEAQLDRFLLHTWVGYPQREDELAIVRLVHAEKLAAATVVTPKPEAASPLSSEINSKVELTAADLLQARREVLQVHLAAPLEEYLVDLVQATRNLSSYDAQWGRYVRWGASPRASLALDLTARARAWLQGRAEVLPQDIQDLAPDVLRHRLVLSYNAVAEGVSADAIIQRLLSLVAVA